MSKLTELESIEAVRGLLLENFLSPTPWFHVSPASSEVNLSVDIEVDVASHDGVALSSEAIDWTALPACLDPAAGELEVARANRYSVGMKYSI